MSLFAAGRWLVEGATYATPNRPYHQQTSVTMAIDVIEQCSLGWVCDLSDNRWFDDKRLMYAGDAFVLLKLVPRTGTTEAETKPDADLSA